MPDPIPCHFHEQPNPLDPDRTIEEWARWVFETCLMWGCQAETAAAVAGHFAVGLRLPRSSATATTQPMRSEHR